MCHTTKHCHNQQTQHSQSASSRNSSNQQYGCSCSCSHSCNINRINSYTLIMALAAFLLPLTQARHLHHQLALGFAHNDNVDSSSSSSSSSSRESSSSGSMPLWHANPFIGLSQSIGDASYDSDSNSDSNSESDASSSSSGSFEAESESSLQEIAQAAVHAAMRELKHQQIRHRRSHDLKFFKNHLKAAAANAAPEWQNPCGGVYQPDQRQIIEADTSTGTNKRKRLYLETLKNNTMREYAYMRDNVNLEYDDIEPWQREYKFLPNMTRPTNAVKLKNWYRHMQTFVGSFAYLGKAHYKYHKDHQLPLDRKTGELHELLESARRVLCEIETTINSSYPNSNGAKLSMVSKAAMLDRLKFYTPADGTKEADRRDVKFSKQLYYQYLDNMWKSLHRSLRKHSRNSKERRQHAAASRLNYISNSNSGSSLSSRQTFSMESSESSAAGAAARNGGCSNSAEC